MRRRHISLAVLVVAVLGSACAGDAGTESPTQIGGTPTASPTQSDDASPVPSALHGVWETRVGSDPLVLTITEDSYLIEHGEEPNVRSVSGPLRSVGSQRIQFTPGSHPCPDTGSYDWSINGDELTLTLVVDPCFDRRGIGTTYTPAN